MLMAGWFCIGRLGAGCDRLLLPMVYGLQYAFSIQHHLVSIRYRRVVHQMGRRRLSLVAKLDNVNFKYIGGVDGGGVDGGGRTDATYLVLDGCFHIWRKVF